MKTFLIVANWKLNNNQTMINKFFETLKNKKITTTKCHITIAPSTVYLYFIQQHIKNYPNISTTAQDVDIHLSGAFTGETSAEMLKEIGVKYVILGHSERRKYHKESNENIAKKFNIVKQTGLTPILCIGENKEEKKDKKNQPICTQQINIILKLFGIKSFANSVIAYEPSWAIGSGITDTPNNIQKTHKFIRNYIANYNKKISESILIQYGGSVNHYNIKNLLIQPDIDGVLIGNASLKIDTLIPIIEHTEKIKNKIV